MSKTQCKAPTKTGERCKRSAQENGYCYIHDPTRQTRERAEIERRQEAREQRRARLKAPNFSQRRGYMPAGNVFLREEMSDELRDSLWNVFYTEYLA